MLIWKMYHSKIKSCVSPQVFYGSRRKTRCVFGSEAFRTMEQTWESQSGGALESNDMVKPLNARKHRQSQQAARDCSRLGPKWQAVRLGSCSLARREHPHCRCREQT